MEDYALSVHPLLSFAKTISLEDSCFLSTDYWYIGDYQSTYSPFSRHPFYKFEYTKNPIHQPPSNYMKMDSLPICMSLYPAPVPKDAYRKKQQFLSWNRSSLQNYYNDEWISPLNTEALHQEIRTALQHTFPHLADNTNLLVTPLAEGDYNKVFLLSFAPTSSLEFIFRVAKPLLPWYKTQSEVATMLYVRARTGIPVPRLYAFNSSMDNALGLEWILMEKMEGVTREKAVLGRGYDEFCAKSTKACGNYQSHLEEMVRPGEGKQIGSLYYKWDEVGETREVDLGNFFMGRLVTNRQVAGPRLKYFEVCGAFSGLEEYLRNVVQFQLAETTDPENRDQREAEEEDKKKGDVEETSLQHVWYSNTELDTLQALHEQILQEELTKIAPILARYDKKATLLHRDMNSRNILIDENSGEVTALLDWEFLGWYPPILGDGYPRFLLPLGSSQFDSHSRPGGPLGEHQRPELKLYESERRWKVGAMDEMERTVMRLVTELLHLGEDIPEVRRLFTEILRLEIEQGGCAVED